mmetsp:Transcript_21443/g.69005  ORF Transcript_21443/g.69005 Transcript_21443/m.69005 type:complete len:231 (+) Transcript_21443:102-794(+)
MRVSTSRRKDGFFETFSSGEAGTDLLVAALRARRSLRINGSVLAVLDDETAAARVSYSEKDRSATESFWGEIVGELEAFLSTAPSFLGRPGRRCIFQVQWLTGREATYWHQDVRWKTHWDVVLFLYVGDRPTPTDLACPAVGPSTDVTPKEYVKHPNGQPEIHRTTLNGDLTVYRPHISTGDVVVIDNRRVWHRTSPERRRSGDDVDALLTIRVKFLDPPPTAASSVPQQ